METALLVTVAWLTARGNVDLLEKIIPPAYLSPSWLLVYLLVGLILLKFGSAQPPDVASLHEANTRHENKIAALEVQLATKNAEIDALKRGAPRQLTTQQVAAMSARLKPINAAFLASGRSTGIQIAVHSVGGGDSAFYARQFEDLFRATNFQVGRWGLAKHLNDDYFYGTVIRWNSVRTATPGVPIGDELAAAMRDAGIEVQVRDEADSHVLELIVGARKPDLVS